MFLRLSSLKRRVKTDPPSPARESGSGSQVVQISRGVLGTQDSGLPLGAAVLLPAPLGVVQVLLPSWDEARGLLPDLDLDLLVEPLHVDAHRYLHCPVEMVVPGDCKRVESDK